MSQQSGAVPTKSSERGTRSAFLARLPLMCRVAELCLTIIVLGLIIDPINARLQHNVNHSALTYVTYAGYLLINCVLIISELAGEPVPKTAGLLFAFTGGVLFVAAGSLIIHDWRTLFYTMHFHPPKMYMDMMISSGIIAIMTACIFFADVGLTIRYALAEERAALRQEAEAAADDKARRTSKSAQQTNLSDFAV